MEAEAGELLEVENRRGEELRVDSQGSGSEASLAQSFRDGAVQQGGWN